MGCLPPCQACLGSSTGASVSEDWLPAFCRMNNEFLFVLLVISARSHRQRVGWQKEKQWWAR